MSIPTLYFPDEYVTFPASRGHKNKTISVDAQGRSQRRPEWPVGGLRYMRGKLTPLGRANFQVVRDFVRARQGSYGNFWIFGANVEYYLDVSIGTGYTGYPITLPFKARTGVTHASILEKNADVDLVATFDSGGAGGELRATAGNVVIAGDTLKVTTTARERIAVRFADDTFDYEIVPGGDELAIASINVIEDLY